MIYRWYWRHIEANSFMITNAQTNTNTQSEGAGLTAVLTPSEEQRSHNGTDSPSKRRQGLANPINSSPGFWLCRKNSF